jgi:shikimate dehydrogenase
MKKYGLIGYPLSHSFSKRFFTEKFENENTNAVYENFEIDSISHFPEVIKNNPEVIGVNVTIPYKQQVIPYLNEQDEASQKVGAVNTVKINRTNQGVWLKGFNTDTYGFEASLKPLLKPHHNKALILGTGGASKAIKFVLNKLGIDFISASIEELQDKEIRYKDIDEMLMNERLLIINATPLGTYPKTETFAPIPYQYINEKHLLFDLVYNPEETVFMKKGKEQGATVKNGYEMLLQQALKSYEIWNSQT